MNGDLRYGFEAFCLAVAQRFLDARVHVEEASIAAHEAAVVAPMARRRSYRRRTPDTSRTAPREALVVSAA